MLREVAPSANRFVALVKPNTAFTDAVVKELQTSASEFGLPIEILRAGTGREIEAAFANLVQKPGGALLVGPDAVFVSRRAQIVTLAARHALPTAYPAREFAETGGLIRRTSSAISTMPLMPKRFARRLGARRCALCRSRRLTSKLLCCCTVAGSGWCASVRVW